MSDGTDVSERAMLIEGTEQREQAALSESTALRERAIQPIIRRVPHPVCDPLW